MNEMEQEVAQLLSVLLSQTVSVESNITKEGTSAWDSMKHIEIIMTVEEHFGVSFAPEAIPRLTSQALLVAALKELKHD